MPICIGPVGFGNTRVSNNYAHKSPQTLEGAHNLGLFYIIDRQGQGKEWGLQKRVLNGHFLSSAPTSCRLWNTHLVQGGQQIWILYVGTFLLNVGAHKNNLVVSKKNNLVFAKMRIL